MLLSGELRKCVKKSNFKNVESALYSTSVSMPLRKLQRSSLSTYVSFQCVLSTGAVPDELKIAKVVPIYKKDHPGLFGNCRPVSVLPCLSKILERIHVVCN